MAILIQPGQGDSLVLYDHNKNYNEVVVAPTSADLFWSYADEPASASRFLSTVPLGIEVSVPLSTEVDRDIVIRAVPRTAYSRNSSISDLDTAEQATGVSTRHDATPVLDIVGKAGTRFARLSIDNWNRFARVRRVDISTLPDFGADGEERTTIYFDLDQNSATLGGAGTAAEFNELPDYIDVERIAPAFPAAVAFSDDTFYVRVSHSAESSARAAGSTYKEKVESLRFTDFSDPLEVTFADTTTGLGGSTGAGFIGVPTSYQYPGTTSSGLADEISISAVQERAAAPYSPGLLSYDVPYGQYISGRKAWLGQQIFADGAYSDWARNSGPYAPFYASAERTNPPLPTVSNLTLYSGTLVGGPTVAVAASMRFDSSVDPARYHFYRATHNGSGTLDNPIFADTALGRIAPAAYTNGAWRYSGRIDFVLDGAAVTNDVPVAVDIYGGFASSSTDDATGTRGLRVDRYGNAVLAPGAPVGAATSGFAYLPTFAATPTGTPAASHGGHTPIGVFSGAIYLWNGTNWVAIGGGAGGAPGTPDGAIQFRVNSTTFGGSANFIWNNTLSIATLAGRLVVNHSTTSITDLGLTAASTLTGSNVNGSLLYHANLVSLDDQNTVGSIAGRAALLVRNTRSTANADSFQSALGIVSEMRYTAATGSLDSTFTAFQSRVTVTAGGDIARYVGFHAVEPGITDDVAAAYGFIADDGLFNGFGTSTPTARLHVSGSTRFDLGSDATGDIFYRSSGGNLARLAAGTDGHVLTLTSGLPSWSSVGGGSSTWNGISNPTGNQSLTHGTNTTTWAFTGSATSGSVAPFASTLTYTPASNSTASVEHFRFNLTVNPTSANTAGDTNIYAQTSASGSGTHTAVVGISSAMLALGSGTITAGYGVRSSWLQQHGTTQGAALFEGSFLSQKGVPADNPQTVILYGLKLSATILDGTIATFYGVHIPATGATNDYGVVTGATVKSGFGTLAPATQMHVTGGARFDLTGTNAAGDLYYRETTGLFTRLAAGSAGQVLGINLGLPAWIATTGLVKWNGIANPDGNQSLTMAAHTTAWTWNATTSTNDLLTIQNTSNDTGTGRLVEIATPGGTNAKTPFRVSVRGGAHIFAIGASGGLSHTSILTTTGTTSAARFSALDYTDNSSHEVTTGRRGIYLSYTRQGSGTVSGSNFDAVLAIDTFVTSNQSHTLRGLDIKAPLIASPITLAAWTGIHLRASSGTGAITDKRALVIESGAGGVYVDLGSDATGDILYRNSSGALTRLGVGTNGHVLTLASGLPSWAAGAGGYATIQDEGTPVTTQTTLNFTGGTVSVVNDAPNSRTNVIIAAANSSALSGQIAYGTGTQTLGGISGTSVSGADVTWAGNQSQVYTASATSGTTNIHTQTITLSPPSNSTAVYRMFNQSFAFGTAFNTSALRLRYSVTDHNQTGTISSFYADAIAYTNSAGTTTSVNGYSFSYSSAAGTTAQAISYVSTLGVSAGTLTSATGFYTIFEQSGGTLTTATGFRMFASGTIGTLYGIILPASYSGFGIDTPTATLHLSGTAKLDLGSDSTGDIWYRNSSGFMTRLGVGTNGHVLTLASGLPSWAATSGGATWHTISNPSGNQALTMAAHTSTWTWNATTSTNNLFTITNTSNDTGTGFLMSIETPGGSNAKKPLRISARGAAKWVWTEDGQVVAGPDAGGYNSSLYTDTAAYFTTIGEGSTALNMVSASSTATFVPRLKLRKAFGSGSSPTVVNAGTFTGRIQFELYNGSSFVEHASIVVSTDGASIGSGDIPSKMEFLTTPDGSATAATRMTIKSTGRVGIATTSPAAMLHVVGTTQFDLGSDATGDIWYRDSSGFFTRLAAGTNGHVLTLASGLPSWAAPTGSGGGYATIQDEGTPATTQTTLNFIGGCVSVSNDAPNSRTNVTIGAVVSSATGSQIPYTTGTQTQSGISGTSVSGADVTWGGNQIQTYNSSATSGTISYYDQNITINPGSNSTAEHRFRDIGATFSTAVNCGSVRLTYADINHGQTGTVNSFYGSHITYGNTAGATTTVSGHNFTYSNSAGASSTVFGYQCSLGASGGTISQGIGYYAVFDRSSGTFTSATGFRMFASGTIGTMYGLVVPLGTLNGLGVASPLYALDVAQTTATTTGLQIIRSYDYQCTGTAADGWGMSTVYKLQSTTTASRLGAQMDVYWQESTDASRTAVASIRTAHKAQATAYQRQIWGGYKDLPVDNTATDIFSITFGTTDHKAVAGLVHLTIFAKQTVASGGANEIQAYRKTVPFVAVHNAANNVGYAYWGGEFDALGMATTGSITTNHTGGTVWGYTCNGTVFPTPASGANTFTFALRADTTLTFSEFYIMFNIELNGEADITLLP